MSNGHRTGVVNVATSLEQGDYERVLKVADRRGWRHRRSGRLNEAAALRALVLEGLKRAEVEGS